MQCLIRAEFGALSVCIRIKSFEKSAVSFITDYITQVIQARELVGMQAMPILALQLAYYKIHLTRQRNAKPSRI